jgi:hypothetical protein
VDAVAQAVTGSGGAFRLAGVPAGRYRLQLVRIGYRPVLSPEIALAAGATLAHDLRVTAQPLVLAAVTVRGGAAACVTDDLLAGEPALAAVWEQARDGVELRRAFERQYRFVRTERTDLTAHWRLRGARPLPREVVRYVSTPDSAAARDRRDALARRARGYRYQEGQGAEPPNEKDLTDPAFLGDHCLDAEPARAPGLVGVRFRPVAARRDADDVRGTLWLDSADFRARYLDVEWVRGDERSAVGRLEYGDVPSRAARCGCRPARA